MPPTPTITSLATLIHGVLIDLLTKIKESNVTVIVLYYINYET